MKHEILSKQMEPTLSWKEFYFARAYFPGIREADQTRGPSLRHHHEIQAPLNIVRTTNSPYFLLIFAQETCPIVCVIKLSKLSNSDQFPSIQRSSMVVWLRGGVRSSSVMCAMCELWVH